MSIYDIVNRVCESKETIARMHETTSYILVPLLVLGLFGIIAFLAWTFRKW